MTRIFKPIKKLKNIFTIAVIAAITVLINGCALWDRSEEPPLLGRRGIIPAPYMEPVEHTADEPRIDDDLDGLTMPGPMDFDDPVIVDDPAVTLPDTVETPTLTYTVRRGDSLWKIAQQYGVSFRELAAHNNIDPDDTLQVGRQLVIPPGGREPEAGVMQRTEPAPRPATTERQAIPSDRKYTVKSGESLWVIARRFGVSVAALKNVNNLTADTIHVGQELVLPQSAGAAETDTPDPQTQDEDAPTLPEVDDPLPDSDEVVEDTDPLNVLDHTVIRGDTLEEIADMYGTTVNALKRVNPNIESDDDLVVNETIKVPFE